MRDKDKGKGSPTNPPNRLGILHGIPLEEEEDKAEIEDRKGMGRVKDMGRDKDKCRDKDTMDRIERRSSVRRDINLYWSSSDKKKQQHLLKIPRGSKVLVLLLSLFLRLWVWVWVWV